VKKRPFEKDDIYTWVDKMKGESDKNTQLRKGPSVQEAMALFNRLASNDDKLEEEAWEGEREKSDPPFYSVYSDEEIESMRKDVEEHMEDAYHAHKYDEGKERYDLIPIECYEAIMGKGDFFWAKEYETFRNRYNMSALKGLVGVKRVLEYGLEKYGVKDSWKEVPDAKQRYMAAYLRHTIYEGEYYLARDHVDAESGLPSAHHALCNIVFLLWFEIQESK